jgi:PadR family transcriptional regulator, regulatory protein PadR
MVVPHRTSTGTPIDVLPEETILGRSKKEQELLLGTLDMLILQTLIMGPAHGHTIAHVIEHTSDDVLQIEQGSLYPALHRLEDRGWVSSYWGPSENNRRARFYRLTAAGRKQLRVETHKWSAMVEAIGRVMGRTRRAEE